MCSLSEILPRIMTVACLGTTSAIKETLMMMACTYGALQLIRIFIYIVQFGLSFQLLTLCGVISFKGKYNKYKQSIEKIHQERE